MGQNENLQASTYLNTRAFDLKWVPTLIEFTVYFPSMIEYNRWVLRMCQEKFDFY